MLKQVQQDAEYKDAENTPAGARMQRWFVRKGSCAYNIKLLA